MSVSPHFQCLINGAAGRWTGSVRALQLWLCLCAESGKTVTSWSLWTWFPLWWWLFYLPTRCMSQQSRLRASETLLIWSCHSRAWAHGQIVITPVSFDICLCSSVQVHSKQGWPEAVRNGPDVDNWLGKKARQEIKSFPCIFVPKRLKGRNLSEDAKGEMCFCLLLNANSEVCRWYKL